MDVRFWAGCPFWVLVQLNSAGVKTPSEKFHFIYFKLIPFVNFYNFCIYISNYKLTADNEHCQLI